MAAKKKSSFFKKLLIAFVLVALTIGICVVYVAYDWVFKSNVFVEGKKYEYLYIRTGSTFDEVYAILLEKRYITNPASFKRIAELKKYDKKVRAGRYRIENGMSNNKLINMLRAGIQEPIQITFNNIRTKEQLASRIGKKLEADSLMLIHLLSDPNFLNQYGLNKNNSLSLFIPNTYEFYWNTSAEQFIERMAKEYNNFWNDNRKNAAKRIGLTQGKVSVLASIVQMEQSRYNDEKPIIAGLYINRIKEGIPLQSDPTLIYALGDFTIKRVLNGDKDVESPYNTYKHLGLPPGPICLPEISSLDAVLNFKKSNYLYMCAKEDLSGRHNFAVTLDQHNNFAQRYRNALNKLNIKR